MGENSLVQLGEDSGGEICQSANSRANTGFDTAEHATGTGEATNVSRS
jgi:hypothetical protein